MKKIAITLMMASMLASCTTHTAEISDSVVVEQINVLEGKSHKYEVKFKTTSTSCSAYYYTNFRHQVGDTLISYYEFFQSKNKEYANLSRKVDSLQKELNLANYYLQMLRERIIIDTSKPK